MAWLIGDSFDFYAANVDAAAGHWDSVDSGSLLWSSATTRFSAGQSLIVSNRATVLTKVYGSNEGTLFVALAYRHSGTLTGTAVDVGLQFQDGSTAQCTVCFLGSGDMVIKSGNTAGSVLATYASAFAGDQWNHFQIKVVISSTAGSLTVRRMVDTSDTYASATNLNTRGGTSNNYANKFLVVSANVASTAYVDDLLVYSASGAAHRTPGSATYAPCS